MPNYVSLKNQFSLHTLTVISVVAFVFLAISNLVHTNILATQGAIVSEMEINTLKLEKENKALSIKISELSRLSDLENKALSLGFSRTSDIVFAPNTNTFALR